MKTFFKNNLIWIFALVLSIGTMSFKLVEKENMQTYWFPVNSVTGAIGSNPFSPPAECDEDNTKPYRCAIAFDTPVPPVSNIEDTTEGSGSQTHSGVLYKNTQD